MKETYFDSNGCPTMKVLSDFIIRRNGECVFSDYNIQGIDSYRAASCLLIFTNLRPKNLRISFKPAVLSLY